MGITGLLPLLKSITVTKPLSDYAGQTVAVDAYVWLHRGTYACASELATGRPTHKYVDYAMGRVRLLRHHGLTPYIVFDGGPLPAKRGTESERHTRRAEHLASGRALAAQGRHAQARECFTKCVDVTPQMAYQFIKALKAEGVAYVVAPYEADAQMAWLERAGLVDAVLTEDSDLLVFGCANVLFKLDHVAATVAAVRRADFGALTAGRDGVSLLGWSDVQFRAMAILSGCDYLPSVPGVGLKTAWGLLRKHKTVENVLRALRLTGKKEVPRGYLRAFRLAEKAFLHQRVYDPARERLVHLTDVLDGEEWDEECESYVGRDLGADVAKKIAQGDVCPISLLPMEDINPAFTPKGTRAPLQSAAQGLNRHASGRDKGKGRAVDPPKGGILNFFGTKAVPHPKTPTPAPMEKKAAVGRESGKRTLSGVVEREMAAKRVRREPSPLSSTQPRRAAQSRFFAAATSPATPFAGPSRWHPPPPDTPYTPDKENVPVAEDEGVDLDVVVFSDEEEARGEMDSSRSWDAGELSSPERSRGADAWSDFDADVISSPPARARPISAYAFQRAATAARMERRRSSVRRDDVRPEEATSAGRVLVPRSPTPLFLGDDADEDVRIPILGPDLRDVLIDGENGLGHSQSSASSRGPMTPQDAHVRCGGEAAIWTADAEAEEEEGARAETAAKVAAGLWAKYARDSGRAKKAPTMRRPEAVVSPCPKRTSKPGNGQMAGAATRPRLSVGTTTRRSLAFAEEGGAARVRERAAGGLQRRDAMVGRCESDSDEDEDEIRSDVADLAGRIGANAGARLAGFRRVAL